MAKLNLYLDSRKKSNSGRYPIVIRLSHKGTTAFIPTGIYIAVEAWDSKNRIVTTPEEFRTRYNDILKLKLAELTIALADTPINDFKDAVSLRAHIYNNEQPEMQPEDEEVGLFDYWEKFLTRIHVESSMQSYEYTRKKLLAYTGNAKLKLTDITVSFLMDWETDMSGLAVNTRAIHFENVRAVMNAAIKEKLLSKDLYPFDVFRIRREEAEQYDLSKEELQALFEFPCQPHQEKYVDIFKLMFILAGINLIDLFKLPNQKKLDRVTYRRSKTGVLVTIQYPKEAVEIIEKYRGEEHLLCFADRYQNHKDFLHNMNHELQRVGPCHKSKVLARDGKMRTKVTYDALFPDLTSYYARHSWATIAADLDISDAVIDMALAHKSPYPMSEVYIRRNRRKVDEAIRRVIDYVFYDK